MNTLKTMIMITKYVMALLAFLLAVMQGANAQTGTEARIAAAHEKFRSKELSKAEKEKELEREVNAMTVKLDAWLAEAKRSQEQMERDYRPAYKHKPGEMNLFPIWEEIPSPIPSLPEAKQVDREMKYGSYVSKVEVQKKQLADMMQMHIGDQRSSEAEMMADARKAAAQNPLLQQMGISEASENMTEAERKALAAKMKNNIMNNPGLVSGVSDPGINAMAQKMMSDPEYRNRYNKMTDAQKQAEVRKFMSNTTVPRNDEQFEQGMKDRAQANNSAQIQALLGKTLSNMQEAAKPYNEGTALANKHFDDLYASIDSWYKKAYDALPVVTMGEMREKQGVGELDKFRASLRYMIQKKEAATRTVLWSFLKGGTKIAFGEFNDFIGSYKWGRTKGSSMLNYDEMQVANAVGSLYDQMIQLAEGASGLTAKHKGQQEQYELIVKQ